MEKDREKCYNKYVNNTSIKKRRPLSEEHKRKLSIASSRPRPWQKCRLKPESIEKIRSKLTGVKKSPEAIRKSAETNRNRHHKRSPEVCEKFRKAMTGRIGALAGNWRGGITPLYRKLRVARLKQVGGSHTKAEWELLQAQYNWTCPCCKKQGIKLTRDHIIPVVKGGSDNIENIQPLCGSCNSRKQVKIVKYFIS